MMNNQRRPRHRRTLGCAVLLACSLAACGTDSAGESSQAASISGASNSIQPTTLEEGSVPAVVDVPVSEPVESASSQDTISGPASDDSTALIESSATSDAPVDSAPVDPLDDLDEDGSIDELCGSADLGGGLVIQPLCDSSLRPTPEEGVVATVGSLLLLPTPTRWDDLSDVDATVRVAKALDGRQVVIYVLGSDTLFDSGSAAIRTTAQPPLAAIVASILARFPTATIDVRGAADSVGSRESNQTLSEQRATAVADQLVALGLDPTQIGSQGLGSEVAVAAELNPDGTVSEVGRQVNRRVEIVVG